MDTPDYRQYSFQDFAQDSHFRQWIIFRDETATHFWMEWLAQNPDCASKVQLAKAFLYALEEKDTHLETEALEDIIENVAQKPILRIPFWRTSAFRIAASALFATSMSWLLYQNLKKAAYFQPQSEIAQIFSNNAFIEKWNPDTSVQKIKLQDGSTVSLYPNSKIRYEASFQGTKRAVYLTGKAFFEVVKNPQKPFWVYTNHISTQVLGTSFLVDAVKNKDVIVEVKTGRVSVYTLKDLERAKQNPQKESAGVVLTPNQQVAYSTKEERLLKSIVEQPQALVVIPKKEFILDETPMAQVFDLLEKMYGISVVYDAKVMENCFLTANLSEESLFKKLDLICKITHSTYEKTDAQIVIHSQGCP